MGFRDNGNLGVHAKAVDPADRPPETPPSYRAYLAVTRDVKILRAVAFVTCATSVAACGGVWLLWRAVEQLSGVIAVK